MLDEGLRQLERHGMQLGIDHLTLEGVCAAADVPRSSSHAAWAIDDDYTPQTLFQRAVLERWITEREGLMFAQAAEGALADAFADGGESLSRSDIIRLSIQAAIEAAVRPDEYGKGSGFLSTDMAIKHALASQPIDERDPQVAEWVRDSETRYRDQRVVDSYRPLAELLRMQPRAEFGDEAYNHLALAIAALVEGIVLRHHVIPERNYASRAICGDDASVPSTLIGVCVEALVDRFFEPIDDA